MSVDVRAPGVGVESFMGGMERSVRPAREQVTVFRIDKPEFFNLPAAVDLFDRAFGGENFEKFEIEADEMRIYLRDHINEDGQASGRWLLFWVAHHPEDGFCGFVVVTYTPWPLCKNYCIGHFHAERPEVREPMINRAFAWAMSHGVYHCTLTNATGHTDDAHMRLFRKYGKGRVIGSVIVYDLEDRYGRQ